jgi:putative tryptophan/tyrosine transport system substrate-binding protein
MRRRELLIAWGGAMTVSRVVRAQQKAVPVIGILDVGDPAPLLKAFREGLQDKGYVEGQNIRLEIRSPVGSSKSLAALARELVGLQVDVIVAKFTPAVRAAMDATETIPIVMAGAGAPVETGLVASLSRPGGNVTGTGGTGAELGGKRIQLIREFLPSASRIGILANVADPFTKPFVGEMQTGAAVLGVEIDPVMVSGAAEFEMGFAALRKAGADCVVIQPSLPQKPAVEMALKMRLPPFGITRQTVEDGALMSYAARAEETFRGAASYVDKILKGAKPADLPVEQATKFELVVNLKTATALGLTIPQSILARADDVIE